MYKRCIHFNTSHTAEPTAALLFALYVRVCMCVYVCKRYMWLTSTDPDKTETCFLIISKMIPHHLEISKLNTQLFRLMSSPSEMCTHTYIKMCALINTCMSKKACMHTQKPTCKACAHFAQMDRCCTSRGTETQQLFPSQSDGLPLIVHEYFTLSQNGCIPDRLQQQPHWSRWSDH